MSDTHTPNPGNAPQDLPVGADAAAAEDSAPATPAGDAARLAELEAKNAELADAYLRANAESLLPVRDSLEAAIATHAAGQGSPEQMLEGVHATLRQLAQALERNKVLEVNPPAGTKFDPHHHQAISVVPADQDANTVVNVLQKGYLIAERVLRPALVTVAAPK
jgi:molecular chaperone GrpE